MFRKTKELQSLVDASRENLKIAEDKIKKMKESQKELRSEIEEEHLENYRNHRKLLAIRKVLREQDYNNIDNLKKKITTILDKKELVDLPKSN
jgi:nucleosome binding factor SPN SPT16 subunit